MTAAPIALLVLLLGVPAAGPSKPLDDADVRQLLRDWAVFERAMASIQEAVPQIPQGPGTTADLATAEAAWAADARVRRVLRENGTTPETFLAVYRKVAQAWWELLERDAREQTALALRREIAALRSSSDDDAREVLVELERGLAALQKDGGPSPDVAVVQRHREELGKVFSPAGSRAP